MRKLIILILILSALAAGRFARRISHIFSEKMHLKIMEQAGYKVSFQEIIGKELTADPYSKFQWNLRLLLDGAGYDELFSDAPRDVKVAVIDSYVAHNNHPDLKNVFLNGWNFIENNGDTGTKEDIDLLDIGLFKILHGQCSASIIAAEHNQSGMAGVFHRAKIIPIRSNFWTVDKAILYAVERGADVIQVGGAVGEPAAPFYNKYSRRPSLRLKKLYSEEIIEKMRLIDAAMRRACEKNIPIVTGIGNEVGRVALTFISDRPGVIVAGPINIKKEISPHSSFSYRFDIFAPGGDRRKVRWDKNFLKDIPGDIVTFNTGTDYDDPLCAVGKDKFSFFTLGSGALPHVTGAAAIIKSYLPNVSVEQIRDILRKSSKEFTPSNSLMESLGGYLSLKLLKNEIEEN
jgi:subtilisin family serine protease